MERHRYYVLHLNPEPWAIGTINGRRMSPNQNLAAFKAAVTETMSDVEMPPPSFRKFTFYLWRQQARYLDQGDKIRQRNQADATNMQKALEDALQGVLFKNDRDVLDIRTVVVDQGVHVKHPGIIIRADKIDSDYYPRGVRQEIPSKYLEQIDNPPIMVNSNDLWKGVDEEEMF